MTTNDIVLTESNYETAANSVLSYLSGKKEKHVMVSSYWNADHFYYYPSKHLVKLFFHHIIEHHGADNGSISYDSTNGDDLAALTDKVNALVHDATYLKSPETILWEKKEEEQAKRENRKPKKILCDESSYIVFISDIDNR